MDWISITDCVCSWLTDDLLGIRGLIWIYIFITGQNGSGYDWEGAKANGIRSTEERSEAWKTNGNGFQMYSTKKKSVFLHPQHFRSVGLHMIALRFAGLKSYRNRWADVLLFNQLVSV